MSYNLSSRLTAAPWDPEDIPTESELLPNKFAAILDADLAGYGQLTGED